MSRRAKSPSLTRDILMLGDLYLTLARPQEEEAEDSAETTPKRG